METKSKPKWHEVNIAGRWRLTYNVRNNLGPEAFGGYHLPNYESPFDHTTVRLRNVNFTNLGGYLIDSIVKDLAPDKDPNIKLLLNWMIAHPEVKLKGIPDVPAEILENKKDNSQITLECRDYLEISHLDEEDYIDKVIGNLSQDKGVHAVGYDRLRYVLAQLDLPYSIPRFEKDVEKKALRSNLKRYARQSMENARLVNSILNNIDIAKSKFEFKEMTRLHVLEFSNGLYKYNNVALGDNYDTVEVFFTNHPEVRTSSVGKLYKLLESK